MAPMLPTTHVALHNFHASDVKVLAVVGSVLSESSLGVLLLVGFEHFTSRGGPPQRARPRSSKGSLSGEKEKSGKTWMSAASTPAVNFKTLDTGPATRFCSSRPSTFPSAHMQCLEKLSPGCPVESAELDQDGGELATVAQRTEQGNVKKKTQNRRASHLCCRWSASWF